MGRWNSVVKHDCIDFICRKTHFGIRNQCRAHKNYICYNYGYNHGFLSVNYILIDGCKCVR